MDSTQAEVSAHLDRQADAMRSKDIERLMALYAADVVYFDVVPPLQFVGSAALRDRFLRWFDGWRGGIDIEVRDLTITVIGDLAVAHWFSRASGPLRRGGRAGSWVRVTNCCRRSVDGWLISHEHVSLPVDLTTASA